MAKPRTKVEVVTMADFYLRDGNTVSGRLLSEDNVRVVVEVPSDIDSTLVTRTYSKKEIDTRTLRTRPLTESRYYTQIAEYFAARTWDFKDDPDDFIQAIRCYERAKQSLVSYGAEPDKLAEIDRAIKKLEDDREVWTKQVESRAKLKKLEYDAEAENRLKRLEKQIAESNAKLNESIKYLDKTAEGLKNDYNAVQKSISDLNKDFVKQINNLNARIDRDEIEINKLWLRLQIVGRPPGGGGK
jgi:DNA repair exonuclease SbcCD ATPase subunit